MTALVVIGAGGFGRETLDVCEAVQACRDESLRVVGVVDDDPRRQDLERLERRGYSFLGTVADWLRTGDTSVSYVIGIGNPRTRSRVAARLASREPAEPLVHPLTSLGSEVSLGRGCVLCAGVSITTNVTVGDHVHMNPAVTVGHDAVIGDSVSLNPQAAISGSVVIEPEALVGAKAVVLRSLRVGAGSLVGAAACVTRDVAPGSTVVGLPARPVLRG